MNERTKTKFYKATIVTRQNYLFLPQRQHLDMLPAVRNCLPSAAFLSSLCHGCGNRGGLFYLPVRGMSWSPRQINQCNNEDSSDPPPEESPRVLITGEMQHFCLTLFITKRKEISQWNVHVFLTHCQFINFLL